MRGRTARRLRAGRRRRPHRSAPTRSRHTAPTSSSPTSRASSSTTDGGRRTRGPHRSTELPSALGDARPARACLARPDRALFCDYDGTLTPIVARPSSPCSPTTRARCSSGSPADCVVGIISGRDLADLRAHGAAPTGVWFAGQPRLRHRRDPDGARTSCPEGARARSARSAAAADELERRARRRSRARGSSGSASRSRRTSARSTTRGARRRSGVVDRVVASPFGAAQDRREAHLRAAPRRRRGTRAGRCGGCFERAGLRPARRACRSTSATTSPTRTPSSALGDDGVGIVVARRGRVRPTPTTALADPDDVRAFLAELADAAGGDRAMSEWLLAYEGFDPARGGAPRGALHARQRLLRHPRRRARGGRRRRATTRAPTSPGSTTGSPPRSPGRRGRTTRAS